MKINGLSLVWTFLIFYVAYEPLQVLLDTGEITEAFYGIKGGAEMALFLSNLIYLFAYTSGAYFVFYTFYPRGKKIMSFAWLIGVALGAILLRYFMQEVLGGWLFNFRNYPEDTSLLYYIFDNLYYAIVYISVGTIFFFVQYAQYREVQQRELLIQTQRTELALLRSQLNPHFLFNILNNIYSLIYYKSDNALKAVEKLSGLLRYALYEKAEQVSVKREVDYLNDFIDLHKMRLEYDPPVHMRVAPEVFSHKIAPFLLIPFVENAFKHGNLKNPDYPLSVEMWKENGALVFTVKNEKRTQQKDEIGGIGIENVQKRLELIYGDRADLAIEETENEFEINLKIDLSVC